MNTIFFHNIDPVFLNFKLFSIYWYSISYILGIVLGFIVIKKLNAYTKVFSDKSLDDLITYSVIGIILGGRIGYVFMYDLGNVISNPVSAFNIRAGGMSFHGGMIGQMLAILLLSKKHKIRFLSSIDLVCIVAPIGLFFGRLANFINGEHFGIPTSGNWGVIFSRLQDNTPRHPAQIYEALLEGLALFCIMLIAFRFIKSKKKIIKKEGLCSGIFLIFYSIFRIICEIYRTPDYTILEIASIGQVLCIPMIITGLYLITLSNFTRK